MDTYTAQIWDDQTLISQIGELSLDAAREVCRVAPLTGDSGRVWCDTTDYNEVYPVSGEIRCGKFGETTLVHI